MFRVGQRVVCVKTGRFVVKGRIYVIDAINECPCGAVSLKLVGIVNTPGRAGTHCCCGRVICKHHKYTRSSFFRPIQDQSVSFELSLELLESIVEERPEHINEPEPA